jgi:hypothetical protein
MDSELKRRADNLTDTLRTMRKWGFTVIQDNSGASQSEGEQMQRARVVAAELLAGRDSGCVGPAVDHVAKVLIQTADAGFGEMRGPREEALVLADRMIEAARSYERIEFQSGYFEGLVAGWHQCGLINAEEMQALRNRMRENLPTARPPAWWNLAARLGL